MGCSSLKEITVPDSVEYIDKSAFDGCGSLEDIPVRDSMTVVYVEKIEDYEKVDYDPAKVRIWDKIARGDYAWENSRKRKSPKKDK